MCGIAGIWGKTSQSNIEAMMESIVHRGPDANGIFVVPDGSGILGHQRLSIMDVEGGDQPIYGDGKKAIIGNGEIYNYPQLFSDLESKYQFVTKSDTEAILHLYDDKNITAIPELDGMFSFAIIDNNKFIAARDPIGIKPLYYSEKDGNFWFASELKAITQFCEDVKEFPPGTFFSSETGFSTYYNLPDISPDIDANVDDIVKEIQETVQASVVKRLMADVPLGAFLSGGLDSSIIAAIAKKHKSELHTFSVGVEGSKDINAARLVSDYLGTIHHEYLITPKEAIAKLPEIIYALESFDQDLVRSAIPCYFTSRLAAQYVKVILTGEGADELFAGYTYYKDITSDAILHTELRRSVSSLHNINLQRVDRLTMAHSIEGRVPFLDLKMIELGQKIPAHLKLRGNPPVEKWILRKAFEDILPDEIVWRKKEQFDEGSGTVDLLVDTLKDIMSEEQAQTYQKQHSHINLRSAEECYYHQIFMDVFDNPTAILNNVARWADRPVLV
ncbi:asparagine synthetase [Crocosphaera subtropica ATCC 51142]|uniref:asparagine synthase (glutamine-hydrolyzing) n=1 Tax=Crocosphaera subtropica (strain ATCC 51142 / BH68) TaxID=43989 RepID=B1WQP9_CROS5|nr:asparagine synthase B [Crocosphaera subtropica]ACB53351.1 asparagine synthetase [Crocosphaera subtropica ATCC 51142]